MRNKTKWPPEAELKEIRKRLSKTTGSRVPPRNPSPVEKAKILICEEIIIYKSKKKLTQRQLAEKIGENESIISKITHYNYAEFTIDRLMKFLNAIYPNAELKISTAS